MLTDIFKKPQILNKEQHAKITISPYENYSFSKDAYLVPISTEELLVAMKSLIVVFTKETESSFVPAVILGTKEMKNLHLDTDNKWKQNRYIPATIRSYPFGIGTVKENSEKYIMIDSEADVLEGESGYKFFNDDQNFSENGQNVLNFVQKVYADIDESTKFTAYINELNLLKQASLTIEVDGEKSELENIFIIDENTLNKLESRKLKKLASLGYMKYIYAHILSLTNKY